jgi:hypothetical protein
VVVSASSRNDKERARLDGTRRAYPAALA